jgi:hypothetical protein
VKLTRQDLRIDVFKVVNRRVITKILVDQMEASVLSLGDPYDLTRYPSYSFYLDRYGETLHFQIIEKMFNQAKEYCQKYYPEAVERIGCYCCYGDGPDLEFIWLPKQEDGTMVLECHVDFDFKISDRVIDGEYDH